MSIQTTLSEIEAFLIETFATIDSWFDKDAELREYQPTNSGWTINQILEHIGLTNQFLLILIDKGTNKALQNKQRLDLNLELENHVFQWDKLREIGLHKFFAWMRPEHMEPVGQKSLEEVRHQLKEQVSQCVKTLALLKNGEGVLHKTTMSVNALGKINVYEYVYFLAQHGLRHVMQMQKNEAGFYGAKL